MKYKKISKMTKKLLISWDRYGYITVLEDVTEKNDRDIMVLAANSQNYWWEKGGLDNIPGRWEIFEGTEEECLRKEKEVRIAECHNAWHNGANRCQCGYKDCPHYENRAQ